MTLRNPHLKNMVKGRNTPPPRREGFSFDYWAKQAHQPGPSKAAQMRHWLKRGLQLGVLLVVFAIISVFALRWQAEDLAKLDCDDARAQKAENSMLALGGCKKRDY